MKETTLQFPSIIELIDFSLMMNARTYQVNRNKLTIKSEFSEADVDLAIRAFKGKVSREITSRETQGRSR